MLNLIIRLNKFLYILTVDQLPKKYRDVSGYTVLKQNLETSAASKHIDLMALPAHRHGHDTEIQKRDFKIWNSEKI